MKVELYWVHSTKPPRLAVGPRPRGDDWLEDEVQSMREAGVDVLVSLLPREEERELDLELESAAATRCGIEFVSFPMPDRGVPDSRSAFARFVDQIGSRLRGGRVIAIHCRQGIGRAPLVGACVLISMGEDPTRAVSLVSEARGRDVLETPEQRDWVRQFRSGIPP